MPVITLEHHVGVATNYKFKKSIVDSAGKDVPFLLAEVNA